jgi:hypothetical protein
MTYRYWGREAFSLPMSVAAVLYILRSSAARETFGFTNTGKLADAKSASITFQKQGRRDKQTVGGWAC